MDEILVKYLLEEASEEEQLAVARWLAADEANQRYFEHFKLIWAESKLLAVESKVDENEAWLRFRQRIDSTDHNQVVAFTPKKRTFSLRAAAAVIVLVLGTWMAYYLLADRSGIVTLASLDKVLVDTLPDGSVVTLNKNSSISYPAKFEGNTRPVTLEGEAFFDVAPDKQKPFSIKVDEVNVTVVGTSFNVKSTALQTEITVETGIVTVAKKEHMVKLLPKQKAVVNKKGNQPVVESNEDDLYSYYRTREFVCNHTPLWKLVQALNSAYGADIVIANKEIRNLPLTTTFRDASLNEILNTVVQTFNLTIEQKEGKIMLK